MTYEDAKSTGGDGRASEALPAGASITVAVCSYGRPTLLKNLLSKLLNDQHGVSSDDYRICVVENSEDPAHFDGLVAEFGQVSNLTVLRSSPPGVSHARNVALEACDTPYIAFLDDDAVPDPRWVERLTRAFLDHRPSVVAGPIRPDWPGPEPEWLPPKYASCLTILDYGKESRWLTGEEFAFGANMAFEVEALRDIGGFNVGIGPRGGANLLRDDDIEPQILLRQGGHQTWYAADASVTHKVHADRLTRNWFRSRMAWQAVSSLLRSQPLHHFERSPHEIRIAADKLGVGELVTRLVEPGDRQTFSIQLDLIYHLFVLMLELKNLDDSRVGGGAIRERVGAKRRGR